MAGSNEASAASADPVTPPASAVSSSPAVSSASTLPASAASPGSAGRSDSPAAPDAAASRSSPAPRISGVPPRSARLRASAPSSCADPPVPTGSPASPVIVESSGLGGPSVASDPIVLDGDPAPFIGPPGPVVLPASANPSGVAGLTAPDDSSMPDDPGSVELSAPDGLGVSYPSVSRSSGARADPCISATGSRCGSSLGRSVLSCLDSAPLSGAAPGSPARDSVENHPASDLASSGGRDVAALDCPCSVCGSVDRAACSVSPSAVEDPLLSAGSGEPFSRGCASTPCVWGVAASSFVVVPICPRTASGGSDPQIGSGRDSAGSCLGPVSPYGDSGA